MHSPFLRRQLSKLFSCSRKLFLFLFLVLFIAVFLLVTFIHSGPEQRREGAETVVEPITAVDPRLALLEDIRNNHLFQYDQSVPTNYSGGHKGWTQNMSKMVIERLNFKKDGFFVECGALDGIYLSNSLLLEKEHGWTGLLVEANPGLISKLKERNRHAWVADVCLSPKHHPIKVQLESHSIMPELSFIKNPVVAKLKRTGFKPIQVQCYPLDMLMDAINRTEIDYLSLDVEGLELDVLKTIPFDRIHIKFISVEVRKNDEEGVRKLLLPLGYMRIKQFRIPSDYISDDLYEFIHR